MRGAPKNDDVNHERVRSASVSVRRRDPKNKANETTLDATTRRRYPAQPSERPH